MSNFIQAINRFDSFISSFSQVQSFYSPIVSPSTSTIRTDKVRVSQGDIALHTDQVRQTLGIQGSGIKIGIISDSFNISDVAIHAADDVKNGDLPGTSNPEGYTTPVQVLKEGDRGKDEGRAMAQIIHDLAPGAEILFYSVSSNTDMVDAIEALNRAGANIIVDDMGFTNQPFFQDGIAAQAVDRVVDQGVTYFSAVGNDAQQSYAASFTDSDRQFTVDGVTYEAHDFNPGAGVDVFNQFSLDSGSRFGPLSLQWNQPFASVSGGQGSAEDLDVFVVKGEFGDRLTEADIVASSTNVNIGGDPLETLVFTNNTDQSQFQLLIGRRIETSAPSQIKYISFLNQARFEYGDDSSAIFGHPNAAGAIAIGSVEYNRTPGFGTFRPKAKASSSLGGTPILIGDNGKALVTAEVRLKPNLIAPDGVNTSFFGSDSNQDEDDLPNFHGTSAAAPHAAAVGALLLEAAGGPNSLTPAEIRSVLELTAIDADLPGTDFKSGSGLIQARLAVQLIAPQTLTSLNGQGTEIGDILLGNGSLSGAGGDDRLLGQTGDDVLHGGRGKDILLGRQGNDVLMGDLGEDILIGGAGSDRFDLKLRESPDVIKDFTPGEDLIGLGDNLQFSALTIGFAAGSTVLQVGGQLLATLDGLHSLTAQNFVELSV
ncbi:MAG: S8 family serine peptidase [Oscillatoriales cyanobacterium RM2_1_1]|nr:S8 family serine peptidase [Oscillatoriales cyanobacterium SM2_3_0]NJO45227.1 S8 family serine peptidase [Oscillatoriales cyanobacterium RM2_1_1]